MRFLPRDQLERLVAALSASGRRVIAPTVRDHAIVYDEIDSARELPIGFTDEQAPGRYRLVPRDDDRAFGYAVGPHSWKQKLFLTREPLYRATRRADGKVGFSPIAGDTSPTAFVGVRACDIAAIAIQDRIFVGGPLAEPRYGARRESALIVAVNCTEAGDLCFCASMGTGPRVTHGADLVLTERDDGFLVEAPTDAGRAVLDALDTRDADPAEEQWVDEAVAECATNMGRTMDPVGLPELLFGNLDHPRWKDVASRCLACGNCTNVCPTCFCSTTETPSDLDGTEATQVRAWDSCFTKEHAEIHGTSFRPLILDRYRQWLTHKVGSWVSQFGTSGCVGCGRCIAWCPVGIDITEEVAAIRASPAPPVAMPAPPPPCESPVVEDLVPRRAEVVAVHRETSDVVTLTLRTETPSAHRPGQFFQLGLPAFGEAPISVSGGDGATLVEHTVRAVGAVSHAITGLAPGAELGVRGPYGRGWPMEQLAGAPVVIVAGGIGIAPLREALLRMLDDAASFPDVRLFYGARTPDDIVYAREMLGWQRPGRFRMWVTVDRATSSWRGDVGVVTRLLRSDTVPSGSACIMCGPEVMMRFTRDAFAKLGVPDERIWVTMERHMKCAAGFCGRCQYGPYFVCKDGPVFRYDEVRLLFGRDGF